MTSDARDLLRQAMQLPAEERDALALELIDSLDGEEYCEGVEAAWDKEIGRRLAEVDAGTAVLTPAEDALAQVQATIKRVEKG